jgi:hypothetical protein
MQTGEDFRGKQITATEPIRQLQRLADGRLVEQR